MSNSAIQAKANALNAKMEGEAGAVLEGIEKNLLRKVARESFACAVKCYDKAGSTGPSNALEQCARNCQVPYQQAQSLVQNVRIKSFVGKCCPCQLMKTHFPTLPQFEYQEVAQFQNRLNRNMQECQEKARDMITPGGQVDSKIENALINCMSKQVDEHIKLLKPMNNRISGALKNFK